MFGPAIKPAVRAAIRPVTGDGVSGVSPGPPESLDIKAKVLNSTSATSATTKAVTGVGFAPKLLFPIGSLQTSAGVSGGLRLGFGSTDATVGSSVSISAIDDAATTNTDRRHSIVSCVSQITDATTVEEAKLSSFGADGFTLDWTTASASAFLLNTAAVGGDDFEVVTSIRALNISNTAESFAHGLSGAPTAVIIYSVGSSNASNATSNSALMTIGMWSSSGQESVAIWSTHNAAAAESRRLLHSDSIYNFIAPTNTRRARIASVDATNINLEYTITGTAIGARVFIVAIRGAKCKTGTFDCAGSTSPLSIACSGIVPKLFIPFLVSDGVDNDGTVVNGLSLSIGASDGTTSNSVGVTEEDAADPTNTKSYISTNSIVEYNDSGTKTFEATAAFSGQSVVLTPTTIASGSQGQGCYLIIGG
jgi:hypothetical protein